MCLSAVFVFAKQQSQEQWRMTGIVFWSCVKVRHFQWFWCCKSCKHQTWYSSSCWGHECLMTMQIYSCTTSELSLTCWERYWIKAELWKAVCCPSRVHNCKLCRCITLWSYQTIHLNPTLMFLSEKEGFVTWVQLTKMRQETLKNEGHTVGHPHKKLLKGLLQTCAFRNNYFFF